MKIISTALEPNKNLGYGYLSEIRTALETARGIAARAPMAHIFWLVPCIVGLFLINFGHS